MTFSPLSDGRRHVLTARLLTGSVAAALTLGVVTAPAWDAAPVTRATAETTSACSRVPTHQSIYGVDIDNDVQPDPVIGIPRSGNGAIDVRLSRTRTIQRLTEANFAGLPTASAGAEFGTAIASVDVNDDGCSDLVVGAPDGDGGRGTVDILFGSNHGLRTDDAIQLHGSTVGERFGAALSIGQSLLIGAPDRTVDGQAEAGAIDDYVFTTAGPLRFVGSITQNTPGVAGASEAGDRFGSVLSGAEVGIPDEDIGSLADAGMVTSFTFDPSSGGLASSKSWVQGSPGVGGVPEAGDRFGAALDSIYVGAPGEDLGSIKDAGVVDTIDGSGKTFTQDTPGIPGAAETGDEFGASVLASSNLTCGYDGTGFLAVGSPGESIGSIRQAGSVIAISFGHPNDGLGCTTRTFYQGRGGLGGAPETGDRLGATLSVVDGTVGEDADGYNGNQFLVGVPGEDVGNTVDAGVTVAGSGYTDGSVFHTTYFDSAGPVAHEQYGVGTRPINP